MTRVEKRRKRTARVVTVGAVTTGVVTMMFVWPARTPAFTDDTGTILPGSVAEISSLEVNGAEQWLTIRGRDVTNPVLLFLHGGPGTPETAFLHRFSQDLEEDFVVVSWEQRGAGKSFSPRPSAESMTLDQLIADTHEITEQLKDRFGQERIYLVGHSWGTLLGMRVAVRRPEDYHALVAVSQTSHAIREQKEIFRWVHARAVEGDDRRALRQLKPISGRLDAPLALDDMSVLLSWVDHYGGGAFHGRKSFRKLFWTVLTSPVYTVAERVNYLRGENFSLEHLYEEVAQVDLFSEIDRVDIPVYFLHGRHDYQVPMAVAYDFYRHLDGPAKRFVVFEESAHGVLYEEPDRFRQVMTEIVDETQADQTCLLAGRADERNAGEPQPEQQCPDPKRTATWTRMASPKRMLDRSPGRDDAGIHRFPAGAVDVVRLDIPHHQPALGCGQRRSHGRRPALPAH